MRRIFTPVGMVALALTISGIAAAQNPPQAAAQSLPQQSAQSTPNATTQTAESSRKEQTQSVQISTKSYAQSILPQRDERANNLIQPDQATSLGELARLARAKKKDEQKPARVYDDDNFPRSANKGDRAPEISIAAATGAGSSHASLTGKVVLLDFWASWCGPCRESLPDLKQFVGTYGGKQLEVVSINEDESESDWQNFILKNHMDWTQQRDAHGSMAKRFGVGALPTYVLIGSDGIILQRYVGASPQESLADRIGPDLQLALESR
ncbi:MAG: TlpA family protein disulfide reductase [Candidatus Acidiferrales bacterium]